MEHLNEIEKNFIKTIQERKRLWEEATEIMSHLGYDLNPIGTASSSLIKVMRKEALNSIAEIKNKLDLIEKSLKDNS